MKGVVKKSAKRYNAACGGDRKYLEENEMANEEISSKMKK